MTTINYNTMKRSTTIIMTRRNTITMKRRSIPMKVVTTIIITMKEARWKNMG